MTFRFNLQPRQSEGGASVARSGCHVGSCRTARPALSALLWWSACVLSVALFTPNTGNAQAGRAGPQDQTIEVLGRSELRMTARSEGVTFVLSGALIDDRGTGISDEEVTVELVDESNDVAWRRAITTGAGGTFRAVGNVVHDGTYALRAIWDGSRWVDGVVYSQTMELRRGSAAWRVVSPLLVPTVGDNAVRAGDAVVIGATGGVDLGSLSMSGTCLENDAFVAADPAPIEAPTAAPPAGEPLRADSDSRDDQHLPENALTIHRGPEAFSQQCELVVSSEQTNLHAAANETVTIVPVTRPLRLELAPVSRPWSRDQAYEGRLVPTRQVALADPALFVLEAKEENGREVLERATWDLASEETVFSSFSVKAAKEVSIRAQHLDALGRPLWQSAQVSASGSSRAQSLRRVLVISMFVIIALALLFAGWMGARRYLDRAAPAMRRTRRPATKQDETGHPESVPEPQDVAIIRDARSGWAIRDARVRREDAAHHWTVSPRRPGVIELPEAARGMKLVAGAPGYFESVFRYPGGETEVSLRPARALVQQRVAALFSASGADHFEDEPGWGTQPPRQVLFDVIRRRYPLWTDALELESSTRPVDRARALIMAASEKSRLSIPNLLALSALLLETAMLAPATPDDVPALLDRLDELFSAEGL